MMPNLRAYFILYVITINWLICLKGKIELSSMSRSLRLSSTKILGDLSLVTKIVQQ